MESAATPASSSISRVEFSLREPEQFRQNSREQNRQQRPDGVCRAPELLRQKCALHGPNQNEWQEPRDAQASSDFPQSEKQRNNQDDGPQGEQPLCSLCGIIFHEQV